MIKLIMKLFCFCIVILLSACHKADSDLQDEIASHQNWKPKKMMPFNAQITAAIFHAGDLRSPFVSAEKMIGKQVAGNSIQSFPLRLLKLTGTVTEKNRVVAFIQTPDNMIYQVGQGDIIGDQSGKVVSIEPNRILIMENSTSQHAKQHIVTLEIKDH